MTHFIANARKQPIEKNANAMGEIVIAILIAIEIAIVVWIVRFFLKYY